MTDPRARIFLVSFALLFFELLAIRWIPSYVRYLSYFNNFILMASFLGIGLGMLATRRRGLPFPPFPALLLLLVIVVAVNRFDFRINSTDVLYYGLGEEQGARSDNFLADEGEERVRAAYPESTWNRLAAIKGRYDPTNLFRLNQNIPPAADRHR